MFIPYPLPILGETETPCIKWLGNQKEPRNQYEAKGYLLPRLESVLVPAGLRAKSPDAMMNLGMRSTSGWMGSPDLAAFPICFARLATKTNGGQAKKAEKKGS